MSAYHAIHESPYDDACPDCAGMTFVEIAARPRQRWALILAVAGVAAIVLLLVGGTRV